MVSLTFVLDFVQCSLTEFLTFPSQNSLSALNEHCLVDYQFVIYFELGQKSISVPHINQDH